MALGTLLAGLTLSQAQTNPITYQDEVFTLKGSSEPIQISTIPGLRPMNTTTGRIWLPVGSRVLTFDEEGIGIRANNRKNFSTLPAVATSEKLFTKEEADAINRAVATGNRTLDLAAISGWEKIGNTVYLLCRWETKAKEPWLEALVAVDMGQTPPQSTLVGKFEGMSTAKGQVNDKLVNYQGQLMVPTVTKTGLAISSYNLETTKFTTQAFANNTPANIDLKILENSRYGVSIQKTRAGTILVGTFAIGETGHTLSNEVRGTVIGLYEPSILAYLRRGRKVLLNLLTGAEIEIPRNSGIEATSQGLFLWTPERSPKQAALYTFGSFRTLNRWSATE